MTCSKFQTLNANTNAKYAGTVAVAQNMLNVIFVHETAKLGIMCSRNHT
jgi:hypothetical protein